MMKQLFLFPAAGARIARHQAHGARHFDSLRKARGGAHRVGDREGAERRDRQTTWTEAWHRK